MRLRIERDNLKASAEPARYVLTSAVQWDAPDALLTLRRKSANRNSRIAWIEAPLISAVLRHFQLFNRCPADLD